MYLDTDFPPARVARRDRRMRKLISLFERDEIEAGVDALIAYLDSREGDTDLEDSTGLEDAFEVHRRGDGPGCEVSDAGDRNGDEADASFPEWRSYDRETPRFTMGMREALDHEDAEDSDSDRCLAGDDMVRSGVVIQSGYLSFDHHHIGNEDDAEPDTDREDIDEREPEDAI